MSSVRPECAPSSAPKTLAEGCPVFAAMRVWWSLTLIKTSCGPSGVGRMGVCACGAAVTQLCCWPKSREENDGDVCVGWRRKEVGREGRLRGVA
eukprot:188165-Chlamydomonas_euryale.AAC.5